jgi:predicted aspartyl protease
MGLDAYVRKYGRTNGPVVYASVQQSSIGVRHTHDPQVAAAERERHYRLMTSLPKDSTVDAPQPALYSSSSAPTIEATGDAVPFTMDNGSMFVSASIGGQPVTMEIDTGANGCTIPESLANSLIASGQATELDQTSVQLADGSSRYARKVSVPFLGVGNHWRDDVPMMVTPDGATPLLGLPVLLVNGNGRFTIDAVNRQILFG